MAPFGRDASTAHPFDYVLLQNTFVSMFSEPGSLQRTLTRLTELEYQIIRLDASTWSHQRELHQDFARELHLNASYGENLDALNDVFSDIASWDIAADPSAAGFALVIYHYDTFSDKDPNSAHSLLDCFARAAREGALMGHRMMCLIQTDDPNLQFPPIGAMTVERPTGLY